MQHYPCSNCGIHQVQRYGKKCHQCRLVDEHLCLYVHGQAGLECIKRALELVGSGATMQIPKCSNCNKTPIAFPTAKLCQGCWEVDCNIDDYILGLTGRERIKEALQKVGLTLAPIPGPVSGQKRGSDV